MAVLTVKLCPFPVPLSVIQEAAPRLRQNGITSAPSYPLPDLDAKVLSDMCDEFRVAVFRAAGKPDPCLSPHRADSTVAQPKRMGACPEHARPGGCQLHNVQCGYPKCDEWPA